MRKRKARKGTGSKSTKMLLPSLPHWRSHISTCPALRRVAIVSVTRVLGYDELPRLGREKGKGKPTTGGFGRSEFCWSTEFHHLQERSSQASRVMMCMCRSVVCSPSMLTSDSGTGSTWRADEGTRA
jgi:hypothetical protein